MGQPQVSVVIPTRDRWELLQRALRGALGQTGVELEVVVVDDGSADGTPERLAGHSDERLRVVRHERSLGVARARNDGIAAAHGEWVAFLDDDDLWAPDKLSRQLAAGERAGAALVFARVVELDASLRALRLMHLPRAEGLERTLLDTNVIPTPSSVLARTELVREVGSFDEELRVLADWDLWLALAARGPAASCPEPLVGYLRHPSNMLVVERERTGPELEHMRRKHAARARAAGVELGAVWLEHFDAAADLAAGRRAAAARGYLRVGVRRRNPPMVARAAGALAGERAQGLAERLSRRALKTPAWLADYAA